MAASDPMAEWAAEFGRGVLGTTPSTRIIRASTRAAQRGAQSGAASRIGADMRLSGFKGGRVKLSVRGTPISAREGALDFRPPGLWVLANTGRKAEGDIFPRRGAKRGAPGKKVTPGRAVRTPEGPRARSSYGPQRRQPRALDTAVDRASKLGRIQMRRSLQKEIKRTLATNKSTYKYRMA
jgi:hypothetical protein